MKAKLYQCILDTLIFFIKNVCWSTSKPVGCLSAYFVLNRMIHL